WSCAVTTNVVGSSSTPAAVLPMRIHSRLIAIIARIFLGRPHCGAQAHRQKEVVMRAFEVTEHLPAAWQGPQRNAILSLLSERTLLWLEEMQMNPDKIPMSAAALRFKAALQAEGLAEGERKGLAKGERKALAKGERKGLAKGERKALAKGE